MNLLRAAALTLLLVLMTAVTPVTALTPSSGASGRSVAAPLEDAIEIIDADEQVVCEGTELDGNGQMTGPEAYSLSHVTGEPTPIALDVLLMLDMDEAVSIARIDRSTPEGEAAYFAAGEELYQQVTDLLAVAPTSYEPLGIQLNWVGWDLLRPLAADGTPRTRTTESQEIIDLAKEQLGGKRPDGVDIVYVVSDVDLTALGTNAVAGQADCIGGVANPENAFAVGEIQHELIPPEGLQIGPITFYKDYFAKIAAHEIGHLMGGHHHYQECGTPAPVQSAVERGENGPCTLMTNAVDFQTLPFSNLNGIVVRGHAETFVG